MLLLFPRVLVSSMGTVSDVRSSREIARMQEVHSCLVMQPWDECMISRREPCLILQGHWVVLHFNVKHMASIETEDNSSIQKHRTLMVAVVSGGK